MYAGTATTHCAVGSSAISRVAKVVRSWPKPDCRPSQATAMSVNDLAETLLEMVTDRPYPDGGMRNAPRPLTGVPMWKAILQKSQVPCKITYSEVMELRVGPDITDFKKIWFTESSTLISLMGTEHPTPPTTPSLSRTSDTSTFDLAALPTDLLSLGLALILPPQEGAASCRLSFLVLFQLNLSASRRPPLPGCT